MLKPEPPDLFFTGPNRTAWEYLFKAIFTNDKARDADAMAAFITAGTCVIDVGSHVGYFSRRFADKNPGGMVLAFEPQSLPRSIAVIASLFRKRRSILYLPFALSSEAGVLELKIPIKEGGKVGIGLAHVGSADDLGVRFKVKKEIVPCQTLDCVLGKISVDRISMIKIDVEGGELQVLKGAVGILQKHRPVVVCETGALMHRFGDSVQELRAFMAGHGYRATDLKTGAALGAEDSAVDTAFLPT